MLLNPNDFNCTTVLYHTIDIENRIPVRQGLRRLPNDQISVLKAEVCKLQKAQIVEHSEVFLLVLQYSYAKTTAHKDYALIIVN